MFQRYSPSQWLILLAVILLFLWQFGLLRDPSSFLTGGRLWLMVGLLVGITVHEACHALAAVQLGDQTPRLMGRLSLNPLRHLDPIGTFMILFGPLGWGKPVQFNPMNLKIDPHVGSAIVSVAGPVANIVTAFLAFQPLRAEVAMSDTLESVLFSVVRANLFLAAFNLIPIPPLDGFGFVTGLLPRQISNQLEPIRQYGPVILLVLVFLPFLGGPNILVQIMSPIVTSLAQLISLGSM
jgi:Zn-dependent protease